MPEIDFGIKTKTEDTNSKDEILQLVSFNIGEEEYGIDILLVQEIIRMVDITRVPNTWNFVVGVINLRGKVVPIIDFRLRLGLERKEYDSSTRIIVVELSSKVIGFVVDNVNEVLRIKKSITEPPPPMTTEIGSEFITSVAKLENRLLILLDLNKVIKSDEIIETN
ncbi:MAG: Chemotaxis signal transduction protein CheW [Ignavibacteria bacterium]|nr:Chemotaxis signal transduction protein CheW [Ignavibacteria bacterium]